MMGAEMLIYTTHLLLKSDQDLDKAFDTVATWLTNKTRERVRPEILRKNNQRKMNDGSRISTVAADDEHPKLYSIKYSHRDSDVPGRQWVTEIGFGQVEPNGEVEFTALLHTDEISTRVETKAYPTAPNVVHQVARNCSPGCRIPGLSIIELDSEPEITALGEEIEYPDRRAPIILVSPTPDGKYLVNVEKLRFFVETIAEVARIPVAADTFWIANLLGKDYAAWRGAVNLVLPKVFSRDKSAIPTRRLLPDELQQLITQGIEPEREIFSIITHRTNLPNSWRHISPEKVLELNRHRNLLRLKQKTAETGRSSEDAQKYVALLEEENTTLAQKFADLQARAENLEVDLMQLDDERSQLRHEYDALKLSLSFISGQAGKVNDQGLSDIVRHALICAINGSPTPTECLLAISALYPERVAILTSAWRSADESRSFVHRDKAWRLLLTLVTHYWELLIAGKGDAEARSVFGGAYAANEGEAEKNARTRQLRTFEYQGEWIEMMKHLKIGRKPSAAETLRIHFHWNSTERKILVGYCGPHLDHK